MTDITVRKLPFSRRMRRRRRKMRRNRRVSTCRKTSGERIKK
jgi:hypothetical protein